MRGKDVTLENFYASLASAGVEFDETLHAIPSLTVTDRETVAVIDPRAKGAVLVDACVQTALAALPRGAGDPIRVPTRVAGIEMHRVPSGKLRAHARVSKPAADGTIDGEVALFGENGELLIEIGGIRVKPIARTVSCWTTGSTSWRGVRRRGSIPYHAVPRPWVILEDDGGVGRAWAARRRGVPHLFLQEGSITEQTGPAQWTVDLERGFEHLLQSVDFSAYEGILCLWPLDRAPDEALGTSRLAADQRLGLQPVIALLRTFVAAESRNVPPLWLATRGAQPVYGTSAPSVSQSTLWGLAGAVAREHRTAWVASSISIRRLRQKRQRRISTARSSAAAARTRSRCAQENATRADAWCARPGVRRAQPPLCL